MNILPPGGERHQLNVLHSYYVTACAVAARLLDADNLSDETWMYLSNHTRRLRQLQADTENALRAVTDGPLPFSTFEPGDAEEYE